MTHITTDQIEIRKIAALRFFYRARRDHQRLALIGAMVGAEKIDLIMRGLDAMTSESTFFFQMARGGAMAVIISSAAGVMWKAAQLAQLREVDEMVLGPDRDPFALCMN